MMLNYVSKSVFYFTFDSCGIKPQIKFGMRNYKIYDLFNLEVAFS